MNKFFMRLFELLTLKLVFQQYIDIIAMLKIEICQPIARSIYSLLRNISTIVMCMRNSRHCATRACNIEMATTASTADVSIIPNP